MTRFPKCSPLAWVVGLASTLLLAIVVPILGHGGNIDGAIFTSNFDGTVVNENTRYGGKNEVYLNGGPQNTSLSLQPKLRQHHLPRRRQTRSCMSTHMKQRRTEKNGFASMPQGE